MQQKLSDSTNPSVEAIKEDKKARGDAEQAYAMAKQHLKKFSKNELVRMCTNLMVENFILKERQNEALKNIDPQSTDTK